MDILAGESHRFLATAPAAPVLTVYELTGEEVFSGTMTEFKPGVYKYDYTLSEGVYLAQVVYDTHTYSEVVRATPATPEDLQLVRKILTNTKRVVGTRLTIFDDDGVTPLISWDLKDTDGNLVPKNPAQAERAL